MGTTFPRYNVQNMILRFTSHYYLENVIWEKGASFPFYGYHLMCQ